jgi:hypothetical protein
MNAISTLTILPKTKAEITSYVEAIKQDILSGYTNPLESAIMLKSFEDIVKALRLDTEIKRYIEFETEKYTEKTIEYAGAKIAKSERTSYQFENCNDSLLNELVMKKTQIDAEIKGREAWLKTLKTITPDINSGELINPPATERTTVITITLSK